MVSDAVFCQMIINGNTETQKPFFPFPEVNSPQVLDVILGNRRIVIIDQPDLR